MINVDFKESVEYKQLETDGGKAKEFESGGQAAEVGSWAISARHRKKVTSKYQNWILDAFFSGGNTLEEQVFFSPVFLNTFLLGEHKVLGILATLESVLSLPGSSALVVRGS